MNQGRERPALSEARRSLVAAMLKEAGAVTITDLQSRFGVSPITARRDLAILAERGLARRTHGGALLPAIDSGEHSFRHRLGAAPEAKARLAEAAFRLLGPGETVFLDASSTTYFVARLISERALALRVITNSLPVLQELSDSEAEVVAIGGTFRRLTHSYVGPQAVRTVRDHFADRLFMSVTGVMPNGVMTDADVLEADVKRAMLGQAEQSVLLLDESKLSARGRQAIAPVTAVSLVLASGDAAPPLRELGATVRAVRARP
jgi:DeoR/GlpR family transcriptional regulator of sugar metabolism